VDPSFVALVKCPACHAVDMTKQSRALRCGACQRELDTSAGYLDVLSADGQREWSVASPEQRFMESELVARVYERFWRPAFVRVIAGAGAGKAIGGFSGELYIHKNSLAIDDRNGPWLDLSCGPGLFTRGMAAAAPGALVIGLDISRAMLDVAIKRAKGYNNIQLVRADAHELPFASESIGGVNNSGALHAYDSPDQAFSEIHRVLRPGGVLVASTFSQRTSVLSRFAARLTGIRRFDPHELRSQLSRIGFGDYEELQLGDGLIFRARKP
jgi:SAM-dependent methyltransferase